MEEQDAPPPPVAAAIDAARAGAIAPNLPIQPQQGEAGLGRGGLRAAFPPPFTFPAERRGRWPGFPLGALPSGGARSGRGALIPPNPRAGPAGGGTKGVGIGLERDQCRVSVGTQRNGGGNFNIFLGQVRSFLKA